jgi:hypothetical protein
MHALASINAINQLYTWAAQGAAFSTVNHHQANGHHQAIAHYDSAKANRARNAEHAVLHHCTLKTNASKHESPTSLCQNSSYHAADAVRHLVCKFLWYLLRRN